MWAFSGVVMFSPTIEWVTKCCMGVFPTFPGWENFVVGYLCRFFIFIAVRLTVFLPEQRPKSKLLAMAIILFCLSINIEKVSMVEPGKIKCRMDLSNLLIPSQYSMDNARNNLEPTRIDRNGLANEPVTDPTIFTTGQQINGQIQHQLAQLMIKEFNRQAINDKGI